MSPLLRQTSLHILLTAIGETVTVDMFWTDYGENLNALCELNLTQGNLLFIRIILKMKPFGDILVLSKQRRKV